MNHPHFELLRQNGHNAVVDALESGNWRTVPYSAWEAAFWFLSRLPRGSTLRPIVRHYLDKLA